MHRRCRAGFAREAPTVNDSRYPCPWPGAAQASRCTGGVEQALPARRQQWLDLATQAGFGDAPLRTRLQNGRQCRPLHLALRGLGQGEGNGGSGGTLSLRLLRGALAADEVAERTALPTTAPCFSRAGLRRRQHRFWLAWLGLRSAGSTTSRVDRVWGRSRARRARIRQRTAMAPTDWLAGARRIR